ncbi:uncharacterized protein LOC116064517 [Sander lucioperca]|uniref:uncharacterized protein LOC116064517 n=1 Tax=Sander lucioperca TaxID=283035 RepID=UPI001653EBCF|nr:uncharacterized protein LOC116064517 [Sander lucioperca]
MAPFLFLLLFLSEAASDQIEVPVNPGDDVTLSCQAAGSSISVVKWSRPDLEPDIVFFYIDGRLDPDNQNPSFKDRVELVDRDLKDGDVSLKLKNVNRHDTGTYTCGVKTGDTDPIRTITTIRTIRTVRLQVPERGSEDRNSSPGGRDGGLVAGVLVVLVLVAAAVGGVLMYRRRQKKRPGPPAASPDLTVTVDPGDDVILPCQAAVVKWTRPDLEPDIVFFYIDGRLETDVQHPSFKDRVELVDRELKDGDASLKLKNVSRHDTGTYTCGVKTDDTDLITTIRTIRTVHLQVPERGSEDRNSSPGGRDGGLAAGVLVVLVLVAAAVGGVLMYRRRQKKRPGQSAASPDLTVTVYPGDDVILPCQAAGSSIRTLKWSREDLDPETVLLYRDGDLELDHQHPDFKDRVELVDRDLKDGDASLILKNVSINDTGTYECRVKTDDTDLIRTIRIICLLVPGPDLPVVTVDPGDDVILPCQAAGSSIRAVKWTKRDLKPTDNVLLYRDGHLKTDEQHPSFKDRVELVDRDLEDGDVSLKLMNVNRHDAGIYECQVASGDSFRFIRILRLQVTHPVPVIETPLLEVSSMD